MSRMRDVKTTTIPMVIGALRVLKRESTSIFRRHIPRSCVIDQMQKRALS